MTQTKMPLLGRVLVAVSALIAISAFFFPLWHYYLEAPQYPEGLNMWIWLHKLTGQVYIINDLNHYVGFMAITEEMYWEFKVLPALTVILTLWGLWVALTGSLRAFKWWFGYYIFYAVFGLVDFYYRLWQFGHTVDPRAPIRIEGYVPPMFGEKQFMNFLIRSEPGPGFYVLVAGFAVAALALLVVWRAGKAPRAASA